MPWLQRRGVVDTPRLDSDLLLADALGIRRIDLFLDPDRPVSQEELVLFKQAIQRRAQREPVAYILGHCGFWKHTFAVNSDVLIPRPETELLVETVLETFPHGVKEILEIGVGSGAVLCSLLLAYPQARGVGTDISLAALTIAERNAKQHNCLDRTTFVAADLIEPLHTPLFLPPPSFADRRFSVILSNPPYVTTPELAGLEPEVCVWEPRHALDGGVDGLDVLRRLPRVAAPFLDTGGLLALEIGATQGEAVCDFMTEAGYQDVTLLLDFGRHPRVVTGRYFPESSAQTVAPTLDPTAQNPTPVQR